MSDNTGGLAFPGVQYISMSGNKNPEGMTLRDYFAAKAMQAILINKPSNDYNWIGSSAYALADAMLKAREQ